VRMRARAVHSVRPKQKALTAAKPMQRRSFLEWTIHGLGAMLAAVIGVPAAAFLIDARNRPACASGMRSVARLSELQVGKPKEIVIRETRRDAWNLHPDDIVGRIWLVRKPNDEVLAFTTICPHLGCSVNVSEAGFVCPCHGGAFDGTGKRIEPTQGSNPAPRDLDALPVLSTAILGPDGQVVDYEIQAEYKRFKTSQAEKLEDH
jgi:menaquinol-cytochrome c reductase iron-sulfur subunit